MISILTILAICFLTGALYYMKREFRFKHTQILQYLLIRIFAAFEIISDLSLIAGHNKISFINV